MELTPRERFIKALKREPLVGRVPHFELVFFLTLEGIGKIHTSQQGYGQWDQMEEKERQLHREYNADMFIETAEKYEHSAIFLHPNPGSFEETCRLIDTIRDKSGDKFFIMLHGDATYSIPGGNGMTEFAYRMIDDPDGMKAEAETYVVNALKMGEEYKKHTSVDGFALCSDYCLNTGPFLSPNQFSEFVTPYLAKLIKGYRDMDFYTIKHTDGNIMPILDQLAQTEPDALHSIDPQAGVDIAEVKRLIGDKISLCGNVNCGLLDTGTDEQVAESVRYALKSGMPNGGYIFCTSNCVYTGMRLARYEMMLDIWRKEGNYPSA